MKAEADRDERWSALGEIDHEVMNKVRKGIGEEDRNILRTIQNGGGYDKVKISRRINDEIDIRCEHCGEEQKTTIHTIWHCPCFQKERNDIGEIMAKLPIDQIPYPVLLGIPPATELGEGVTYWGQEIKTGNDKVAE